MNLINRMRHQTAAQKNETPAHLQGKMKTSTRGIYMFVSQKNKLIENSFPDGDVLRIENAFPDGDVLHIKNAFPDGNALHIENAFPDGDLLHIKDIFPDGDVLHIKKITGGTAHGSI